MPKVDVNDDTLHTYVEEFMQQKLFSNVPLDKRDEIAGVQLNKQALAAILFECLEFVSFKIENELNGMAKKENSTIH